MFAVVAASSSSVEGVVCVVVVTEAAVIKAVRVFEAVASRNSSRS